MSDVERVWRRARALPFKSARRVLSTTACLCVLSAWADDVPVGYISSYAPKGMKRADIVEVHRKGRAINLDTVPVFVAAKDAIRIKQPSGVIKLAFRDGKSETVAFGNSPYVVPAVNTRRDWRDIFSPPQRPSPAKDPEAITADLHFIPEFGDAQPVGVYLSSVTSRSGGTSSRQSWIAFDSSSGSWVEHPKPKADVAVFVGKAPKRLSWRGGTPPFKVELLAADESRISVTTHHVSTGLTPGRVEASQSNVELGNDWIGNGWTRVGVTDAKGQSIYSHLLVVDENGFGACPFAPDPTPTLDSAVVCAAWQKIGETKLVKDAPTKWVINLLLRP